MLEINRRGSGIQATPFADRTRASTPDARFKPVQETNLPGRKAERLGSHTVDGVIRSGRSQVKATLFPGLRTCADHACDLGRQSFGIPAFFDAAELDERDVPTAARSGPSRCARADQSSSDGGSVGSPTKRSTSARSRPRSSSSRRRSRGIAELAVRTPHPPYRLDARGEAGSSLVNIRLSKGAMFDHTLNS
jgi:hypothetical protein